MECDFYLLLFFFSSTACCWFHQCVLCFCAQTTQASRRKQNRKKKKEREELTQQQRPSPNAVQIHHRIQQPRIEHCNSTEKYDFDDVDADDDTHSVRDGNREMAAHPICDARRALLLLLLLFRVHNSIDFNGIHARIRNLFNFDAIFISALNPNQMHGHTRTTQKQRSRDEMWKRTRLGSSVRTNRLYYYFFLEKIEWTTVCDNGGW